MKEQLLEIGNSLLSYLFNNIFSIFALIISIITLRRNSVSLDFDSEKEGRWAYLILLDSGESIFNENGLYHTNVRIINNSNFDLSYFDLKILDETNNKEMNYYNNLQFNVLNDIQNRRAISLFDANSQNRAVSLPQGSYGLLKAHTVTSFDFIVTPEPNTSSLFIIMKVTTKKGIFPRLKAGYINSKYHSFSVQIPVEQSRKPDYEKFEENQQNH